MTNVELTSAAAGRISEVVTEADVRYVEPPFGVGRFAFITLDNGLGHTRPNTFGAGGLTGLDAALESVANDVVGVGITGNSCGFVVGADLKLLRPCGGESRP